MANLKQLIILKDKVERWNQWREQHPEIKPDLRGANLSYVDYDTADIGVVYFNGVNLCEADLTEANLRRVSLVGACLMKARLHRADLSEADLSGAKLSDVDLSGVDLTGATLQETRFARVDLRNTRGLAEIKHSGPSFVELHTVQLPQNGSMLHFLRGIGLSDEWIDFYKASMKQPINYHSVFISYSSKDDALARRLYADLQSHNVRCWFAPEDLKIGDKFWHRIDESIRLYDKLLVVLSEHSVQSDWVEREVMAAHEKEKQGKTVLFPIALDDAVKDCTASWAADLRRQRHIGDFRGWKNHDDYQKAFDRLLRDLKGSS